MTGHRTPISTYFIVFAALMLLLGLTVEVSRHDLGPRVALGAALAIAVVKAVLIVLYFMGVKHSSQRVWLFSGAGFFWLLIMIGILDDYFTRH